MYKIDLSKSTMQISNTADKVLLQLKNMLTIQTINYISSGCCTRPAFHVMVSLVRWVWSHSAGLFSLGGFCLTRRVWSHSAGLFSLGGFVLTRRVLSHSAGLVSLGGFGLTRRTWSHSADFVSLGGFGLTQLLHLGSGSGTHLGQFVTEGSLREVRRDTQHERCNRKRSCVIQHVCTYNV